MLATLAVLTPARAADPDSGKSEYQLWIARYTKDPFVGGFSKKTEPLKLAATQVSGEDQEKPNAILFESKLTVRIAGLTADGTVEGSYRTWRGTMGGGGEQLSAAQLARVDQLLANLPDDKSVLPPANRRLLIQAAVDDHMVSRVYDLANAPAEIWEVLRLAKSRFGAYMLEFKPESEIAARGYMHDGFLCLAPGGKQLLFAGLGGTLQFWEPVAHELIREVRLKGGGESIAFSLDGSRALVSRIGHIDIFDTTTWQRTGEKLEGDSFLSGFRFTSDGRYVAAQYSERPLRFFDVQTWQPADKVPEVPEDATRYFPAAKSKRAVVQFKPGKVSLWDTAELREIAILSENAQAHQVRFAPDESLVAVDLRGSDAGSSKFGIWDATSGKLVHELRPFERLETQCTEGLLWSPDGRHVLAGTTVDLGSSNAVSVFSVKSGRQRAQFSGCIRINGVVVLPNGRQLVVGDENGKIRFWNYPEAMEKIQAFEKSLGEE